MPFSTPGEGERNRAHLFGGDARWCGLMTSRSALRCWGGLPALTFHVLSNGEVKGPATDA